jgi:CubicO group peptidase (beta-lactamase class C family)
MMLYPEIRPASVDTARTDLPRQAPERAMQADVVLDIVGRHHRRWMAALSLATLAVASPASAEAVLPNSPEAFGRVVRAWSAENSVDRVILVVRRDNRIVYQLQLGGANADEPVHIASLSKAITAVCVATLVRNGILSFDAPMSSVLAKFRATSGHRSDPRFARVTVGQLLTHRAGFGKQDPGSGPALTQYLRRSTATARPSNEFLGWALSQRLMHDPGSQFVYSNTGYLALGAIIEEATGKRYVPYCREAVLAPHGLQGDLEPAWRVLWSYAGWRMRPRDYLAFLDVFDADDQRLGPVARSWMLDPEGKAAFAGAVWYGLGTYVRKAGNGINVSHFGSWAYNGTGVNARSRTSFLTLAVRRADGTSWLVHASPRPRRFEEYRPGMALEQALLKAYRGIKTWN